MYVITVARPLAPTNGSFTMTLQTPGDYCQPQGRKEIGHVMLHRIGAFPES